MSHDRTTIFEIAPDETPLLPQGERLLARTPRPGGAYLRVPTPVADLLREPLAPCLSGPVLIARAGSPIEQMLPALVYPLGHLVTTPAPPGQRVADEIARFCLGRTSANDVIVDDLMVSKRHASIVRRRGDRWAILDEDSSNGTFVDGRRLRSRELLPLGLVQIVRLGPRATFAFMHPEMVEDYLAHLRAEHERRGAEAFAEGPADRDSFDRAHATARDHFHPLAAQLVALLRQAPAATGYRIVLEPKRIYEIAMLSKAVALVENDPAAVVKIEAKCEDGRSETLFDRNGPTPAAGNELPRIPA
jgi:hypothetical protein